MLMGGDYTIAAKQAYGNPKEEEIEQDDPYVIIEEEYYEQQVHSLF